MCELETSGIRLKCGTTLYGTLACVTGDNLGRHQVFNFMESFRATHFCSLCHINQSELQTKLSEKQIQIRSVEEYNNALVDIATGDIAKQRQHGMKGGCPLNKCKYWSVPENMMLDCMHDLFEGVVSYELKLLLNHFINIDNFMNLDNVNNAIAQFPYGRSDAKNRPSEIKEVSSVTKPVNADKKIRQSASQCWCLLRLLPFIIGHLIPENNEFWTFLLELIDITELLCAPRWAQSDISQFRENYHNHLHDFKKLFPEASIIPKMHFLAHYGTVVTHNGPPAKLWCFSFESKAQYFKKVATHMCNFKRPQFTLSNRHQDYISNAIFTNQTLSSVPQFSSYESVRSNQLPVTVRATDEIIDIATKVAAFGCVLFGGHSVLPLHYLDNGLLQFVLFKGCIPKCNEDGSLNMIVNRCETVHFHAHTRSYYIKVTTNLRLISSNNLLDKHSLDMYAVEGSSQLKRVRLRYSLRCPTDSD